jgi:hypothetical protein
MFKSASYRVERIREFFLVALSHESVYNYYNTNFQLMQHHNYSLTELENMMPWEREIYIKLLLQYLEEEKERNKRK